MNEYEDMYDLFFNWLFWFVLGTFASFIVFSLIEYFHEQRNQ